MERVAPQLPALSVSDIQSANHGDVAGLATIDLQTHAPQVRRHVDFRHAHGRAGNLFVAIFLRNVMLAVVGVSVLRRIPILRIAWRPLVV